MEEDSIVISTSSHIVERSPKSSSSSKHLRTIMIKWCFIWLFIVLIIISGIVFKVVQEAKAPPMPIDELWPEKGLDIGMYWFGANNSRHKQLNNKIEDNPLFDSNKKKLLIYSHGWAVNSVEKQHRDIMNFSFNDPKFGLDVDMAESWLNDGWNIGFFYWHQLSDEPQVILAENKIWTTKSSVNMRWKQNNLTYTEVNSPNETISQLFYNSYMNALKLYPHDPSELEEIRFIGQSLGNQIVLGASEIIANKIDKERSVSQQGSSVFINSQNIKYFEVSAKLNSGFMDLFLAMDKDGDKRTGAAE